jgi:hypothetical protein
VAHLPPYVTSQAATDVPQNAGFESVVIGGNVQVAHSREQFGNRIAVVSPSSNVCS